jgi:predicted PurR-regulated permease PerM
VAPRLVDQASALAEDLPQYSRAVQEKAGNLLSQNPQVRERILKEQSTLTDSIAPVLRSFVSKLGRYTLSLAGVLIGALVLFTTVVYAVASPRPLVRGALGVFPPSLRDKAFRALVQGSQTVVGWVWSNVIIGGIEAVGAGIFLSILGIPGALVWASLTFFAELVPKIGAYLMAVPPILVAFASEPIKGLWVAIFYIVIQWIAGDLIGPLVRAKQMKLHAVSVILATVAMGAAFGLLGALLATPLVGFAKAFYDEFHESASNPEGLEDEKVEAILERTDPPQASLASSGIKAS